MPGRAGIRQNTIMKAFAADVIENFPFAKQGDFFSHHDFDVFTDKLNKILQATPPKLRREAGMRGNAANKKAACE